MNEDFTPQDNLDISTSKEALLKEWKYVDIHPKELIIKDTLKGI